ncbi:hypothetical protein TrLO_g5691 [Triparma laevis f. longispina]|uniref:Uncharacterized protein n=1 Tax=Triparma laevis f. longispina TaxID=1714387 RepID=A0A9W7DQP9_9STRA|nr:hypothetical protein TrLO_g5691 [Triparma laevis f. longispina]
MNRTTSTFLRLSPLLLSYPSTTLCAPNLSDDLKKHLQSGDFNSASDVLLKGISAKVEDLAPSTGQASGGFCAGFVSGYALKKIGKGVSFLVGLGFIGLQTLSYTGYISIDYTRAIADTKKSIPKSSKGGDIDVKEIGEKVMEVLSFNLPAGGGFGAGVVAGVRTA